ncbi:MAG: non-canonical purine NTP pyrophosphatase [Patescibacteria group bacterium]
MILICSNNQGKVAEISRALGGVEVASLKDRGIELDVVEDQNTLEGNALKKAREGAKVSGLPTIADDTGLFIDALDGEPGVKVRRWPGYEAQDEELIALSFQKLKDIPEDDRTAKFVTVMAYVHPDGTELIGRGEVAGRILDHRTGEYHPGLPFDTIFYSNELMATFADAYDQKDLVSHRVRALEHLKAQLSL